MDVIIYYLPIINQGEGRNEENMDNDYDGDAYIGHGTLSTASRIS